MPRKTEVVRRIDQERGTPGGNQGLLAATATPVNSTVPGLDGPTGLEVLSNMLAYSAQLPRALVTIRWRPPQGGSMTRYEIEVATDSGFTTGRQIFTSSQTQAVLELTTDAAGITYYVRVRGVTQSLVTNWSDALSFLTAGDTAPAPLPTGITATFNAMGDLVVEWTIPTATSFKDVEVRIYESAARAVLKATLYDRNGVLWTSDQNRAAGSGTPDPSLFVVIRSRSWTNVLSAEAFPAVQPTKALPADVTGLTQSWSGDTGAAGPDLRITWSVATGAIYYRLTLAGIVRNVYDTKYVHTLNENKTEHAGVPSPNVTISVVAVDGLDQVSATPASTTATNAAPAQPGVGTITLQAFFSTISINVNHALPLDGIAYRYRLIQTLPSAADVTWDSPSSLETRPVSASATYQVGVKIVDVFGQESAEQLSTTSIVDALTLETLRSDAIYSDSAAVPPATLYSHLADDNVASGGVGYLLAAGWTTWVRFERVELERYRTVTLSMTTASGTSSWYIRTSQDGSTWSYFAGPVVSSRILTAVADAAAAQAAAISAATLGGPTTSRVDLPTIKLARYIEVWFRNTTATTTLREFYPRRLVQSDDMEAESIKAINVAVASLTADRLNVSQLSAITANMGSITAGTITGALIRTAASGSRVELTTTGITTYDSLGNVQITATTATDGRLTAGAGAVRLDQNGIRLITPVSFTNTASYQFFETTGNTVNAAVSSSKGAGINTIEMNARPYSGATGAATVSSGGGTGAPGNVLLLTSGGNGTTLASFSLDAPTSGATSATLQAASLWLNGGSLLADGGIAVGHSTSPGTGGIHLRRTDGSYQLQVERTGTNPRRYGVAVATDGTFVIDDITATVRRATIDTSGFWSLSAHAALANTRLRLVGHNSSAASYALFCQNFAGANLMYVENNGTLWANVAWTVSDERRKGDIRRLRSETVLDRFRQIQPSMYKRRLTDDGELYEDDEVGLVAQELGALFPDIVRESSADRSLAISYQGLTAYHILATIEIDREMREMRRELDELRASIKQGGRP